MTTYIPHLTLPQAVFDNPAVSIALPIAFGAAVGFGTTPTETQKSQLALRQPPYRPPPAAFPVVWTALYGLTGYAAYRAVHYGTSPLRSAETIRLARHGATLYTIQLGLNLAFMPLFYAFRRPVEASIDLVALLGLNSYLIYVWSSVDRVASWCLAPYLGWLGFATYLSVGTGYLNKWNFNSKQIPKDEEQV
ncbi:hypothetical protein VTK73DRAFT_3246 [Phialemonium thermophilum]|uniref:TspO/MBR-related protein n=1 Tax=Phialemonium thermophilum TaxID=223376 RepID=A0ABR3Y913_9PEZI